MINHLPGPCKVGAIAPSLYNWEPEENSEKFVLGFLSQTKAWAEPSWIFLTVNPLFLHLPNLLVSCLNVLERRDKYR